MGSFTKRLRTRTSKYFYDCELRRAGILESLHATPSDLDNPIHPIFSYKNFSQLPAPTYKTLALSLRFASLLITEIHCLEWWVFILYGRHLPIQTANKQRSILLPIHPITTAHLSATRDYLLGMADRINFTFNAKSRAYGIQFRSKAGRNLQLVQLSGKFQGFIEDGGFASSSLSQQLRFSFFFALNIVHELSHAVFDTRADSMLSKEPYFAHDVEDGLLYREIGDSWERFVFGCKIQPLDGDKGCPEECGYGLHMFTPSAHGEDLIFGAVPMEYVSALMSKRGWEAVAERGIRMLRCPKATICALDIVVKSGGTGGSKRTCSSSDINHQTSLKPDHARHLQKITP
ncbi:hypothetical protein GP486_005399 [Trichoglossum hirsutum]|uniref:Uncharacterized protein n=1 Tax=Trichoglossum hirsutum TaxID=265104 RepID=A0A9P8L9A0_9PEZI|nr:hypothetical protein GP486_005399 [Trichoglossum hirsutum]